LRPSGKARIILSASFSRSRSPCLFL
jgi:hypothetical protein